MLSKLCAILTFSAVMASVATSHAATSVSFDGLTGTATPLTVGSGSNAVTFSSAKPGTFSIANTGFYSGIGTALGDYNSFSGDVLTISFASPVTQSLVLPFGVEDFFGSDTITVATNTGYTTTATTTLDSFGEPEGAALVSAIGYTTLTVTSANPYAIGGIASVPEPLSLSIMAVGLVGTLIARRRRG